ncbi:hypothetical protein GCM10025875_26000 [Litorihabitans aurantiacus]|uniref:Beta-lactamase-related domain-containing protein n=1 Tax=Litorihabitans aurantiacus TaxID=1930061 RepID=A0AA37XFR7_9MICO|nr:hypothetical protein GCM10025875_26000 [Litorihabitans aurantiacus]
MRGDLRAGAMVGTTRRGRRREAWVGEGIAPAGGVRATAADVARLAAAILAGGVPGLAALEPRTTLERDGLGPAWLTSQVPTPGGASRTITWHNGGTGGFRSYLGLDRERGRAVVAISPRASAPDRAARAWLAG